MNIDITANSIKCIVEPVLCFVGILALLLLGVRVRIGGKPDGKEDSAQD